MKSCPYCAEEIQDAAIKCRHCGEFLEPGAGAKSPKEPWYYNSVLVVVALLAVGPFALPFVWLHPRYHIAVKVVITVAILAATVWMTVVLRNQLLYLQDLWEQIEEISGR